MLGATALFASVLAVGSGPPCDAAAVFARVRAATGGAAWSHAGEIVGTGTVTNSGLRGTVRIAKDLRAGRGAEHDDLGVIVYGIVFDGRTTWQQDASRGVHELDAPDSRRAAVTGAYFRRNGFFRPDTDPASFRCHGAEEGQHAFDVVDVTPRGGRAFEMWIDRATSLVDRTVQHEPTVVLTAFYGDYRTVGTLVLPFEMRLDDGDPRDLVVHRIARYEVRTAPRDGDFAPPPAPRDYGMFGDALATGVPLDVSSGSAVVYASINGHAPMPFLLDTGARAAVTVEAARALGLHGTGRGQGGGGGEGKVGLQFARTKLIAIGNAELRDIPFIIIPYNRSFADRGPGRAPLAGFLGLEIFERFAAQIDYGNATLTLVLPNAFHYRGVGTPVPIVFQADVPLVRASADGHPGLFQVDTGNDSSTVLFGPFLRAHGFLSRYKAGVSATGSGIGGPIPLSAHRLRTLRIAGYDLDDFIVAFSDTKKGAFSSRSEAGNIGFDVLSQFVVLFDFARKTMYVERRANAPVPRFRRVGIGVAPDGEDGLRITGVLPNSPASDAKLAAGDHVLSIDGISAVHMSPAQFLASVRRPVGTRLTMRVNHGGTERTVTLVLRELLCEHPAPCSPRVKKSRAPAGLFRTVAPEQGRASARRSCRT